MFRRMAALIALVVSLLVPSAGVLGAETETARVAGSFVTASFTNVPEGEWPPLAGEYFRTEVFAGSVVDMGSGELSYDYICAFHDSFVIDENGEFVDWTGVGSCGEVTTITIDRRLNTGRLVASLPVSDCLAWDDETGHCLEPVELGSIEVDLTLTGVGPIERHRGTSTGGTAGSSTSVWHGVGTTRAADTSGTLAFNGASLIDGATSSDASLGRVQEGYVGVYLGD